MNRPLVSVLAAAVLALAMTPSTQAESNNPATVDYCDTGGGSPCAFDCVGGATITITLHSGMSAWATCGTTQVASCSGFACVGRGIYTGTANNGLCYTSAGSGTATCVVNELTLPLD